MVAAKQGWFNRSCHVEPMCTHMVPWSAINPKRFSQCQTNRSMKQYDVRHYTLWLVVQPAQLSCCVCWQLRWEWDELWPLARQAPPCTYHTIPYHLFSTSSVPQYDLVPVTGMQWYHSILRLGREP